MKILRKITGNYGKGAEKDSTEKVNDAKIDR